MGISAFWQAFFAIFLAASWLLPHHTLPWLGFHADAWCALVLTLVSLVVLWRAKFKLETCRLSLVLAFISTIPIFQFSLGQIHFFGIAWVHFSYVLGFATAVYIGFGWERRWPSQVGNMVFTAVVIAGLGSFVLQLHQLLDLNLGDMWMLLGPETRQSANLGQSNHVATLQVLAVAGIVWGYAKQKCTGCAALILILVLLSGIALTESRTAWLEILFVGSLLIWKRKAFKIKNLTVFVIAYFVIMLLMVLNLNELYGFLRESRIGGSIRPVQGDARLDAWQMFVAALMLKPWFGYGFGQVSVAQFAAMNDFSIVGANYMQSHNLLIDLLLWCGIPLGATLFVSALVYLVKSLIKIDKYEYYLIFAAIGALMIHAMLEYPLQYAYFLLPFGLLLGALAAAGREVMHMVKAGFAATIMVLVSAVVLTITVIDYFKVEQRFYGLRFELRGIASDIPKYPPEVLALTQWRDYIKFARIDPASHMSDAELGTLRELTLVLPSALLMYKLASGLAFAGEPAQATGWLRRVCQNSPRAACDSIRVQWAEDSKKYPEIEAIPFPDIYGQTD